MNPTPASTPGNLAFPEPPNNPHAGPANDATHAGDLARENAQITAERDRALAEIKRLRDLHEATGLRRTVGAIAEGLGAALAFTLMFALLALLVAGVMFAFGWRP